jgi:hypothetical protein
MFDNLSREQSDKFSISHTGNDKFGHDQYSIAFSGDQGRRESHQVSSGHTIYDSVEGTFNSISIKNTRRALDSALSENLPKDNPHAWADMWNSIHNVADTPVATPLPGSPVLREPPSPITSRPPSLEPDVPPEKRGSYYNLEAQIVLEVTLAQNIPRNFSEQAQEIISKRVQEYKLFSDMNVRTGGDKYTHLEYAESLKGEFLERLNNLSHSTHSSPHSSPKETSSPQPTAHDDGPSMEGAESSAAQTRPLKRAASNASSSHKSDVEMERAESSAGQPGPLRKSARIANAPLGQLPTPSPRNPGGSSRQGPQRG